MLKPHVCAAVHALACLELEGWLASGGADGTVRLWRVEERRLDDPATALLLAGAPKAAGQVRQFHHDLRLPTILYNNFLFLIAVATISLTGQSTQVGLAGPVSAEVKAQVSAIFGWLDPDATGLVECGAMQRLAGETGGELSSDDFVYVCGLAGCDPKTGLTPVGLLKVSEYPPRAADQTYMQQQRKGKQTSSAHACTSGQEQEGQRQMAVNHSQHRGRSSAAPPVLLGCPSG